MLIEVLKLIVGAVVVLAVTLPFMLFIAKRERETYEEIIDLLSDDRMKKVRWEFIERIKNADTDREMDERE